MTFSEFFIKRPVFATVLSIVIILLGTVAISRLYPQIRHFPKINRPIVSVEIKYPDAGPIVIEQYITNKVEKALLGLEGLKLITSNSTRSDSKVQIYFRPDRDIEHAANDVRNAITRIWSTINARGITRPIVRKTSADSAAVLLLTLSSDRYSIADLTKFAKRLLEHQLGAIKGVAKVNVGGASDYSMKIILDPTKMAGFKISTEDVKKAIKSENVLKSAGKIITKNKEISVITNAELLTETDFRKLIITQKDGHIVRLGDIGEIELTSEMKLRRERFNGKPTVAIGIHKSSIANSLEVASLVKQKLPELQKILPSGATLEVGFDHTTPMQASLKGVQSTLIEAVILVILVVLFSLGGSLRATLIPVVTIPVSLMGAIFIIYLLGFSLNTLTFLAMILGIGLVVDDSIVVLENVYHYLEKGLKPIQAAINGVKEIQFAVIAMTLTLASVYFPIGLIKGQIGKLFIEFAVTLASAVLVSGFVSLTLTPPMCAYLLRSVDDKLKSSKVTGFMTYFDYKIKKMADDYGNFLTLALKRRAMIISIGIAFSILGAIVGSTLKRELFPKEDNGVVKILGVPASGATVEYNDGYMKKLERNIRSIEGVRDIFSVIKAMDKSEVYLMLEKWRYRKNSSEEISAIVRDYASDISGMQLSSYSMSFSPVEVGGDDRFTAVLTSYKKSLDELQKIGNKFMRGLKNVDGLTHPQCQIITAGQSYEIEIDRDRASRLGVKTLTIAETLETLLKSPPADHFTFEGAKSEVKLHVAEAQHKRPDDLFNIFVPGMDEKHKRVMVPIAGLIKIKKIRSPSQISHYDGKRSIRVFARRIPGYGLGEIIDSVNEFAEASLPEDVYLNFGGQAKEYQEEKSNFIQLFVLALAFIFLVLAAQYESFRDPLLIMLSVPLSIASAMVFLKIFGGSLGVYSMIGFVTLIGLITKHAIMIIDFANDLQRAGKNKYQAVIEAAQRRFRPILMTTFAMVIGALPLVIDKTVGSIGRSQIGWVIIGGMSLGTLFTLFVIPAIYTYFGRDLRKE